MNSRGGREDLYRIANELQMDVDDLLPIVEAATLLSFVTSEHGDVGLTGAGKAFAEAGIADRKRLFSDAALANISLIQQMHGVLMRKPDHTMPLEFFRDILERHFSESDAQQQIDTALNWGRYADLLSYDADTDRLSLYESSPATDHALAP